MLTSQLAADLREIAKLLRSHGHERLADSADEAADRFETMVKLDQSPGSIAGDR